MDVERYKKFAAARFEVNQRIIETYLDRPEIIKAGRGLGIVKGGQLLLEDEEDVNRVMDFGIRKLKIDGKRAIDRALEDKLWDNEFEAGYIVGLTKSTESLMEVVSADPEAKTVTLRDRLAVSDKFYTMNDIAYSETVWPGALMYISLVPVEDTFISNGGGFTFSPHKADLVMFECNRPKNTKIFKDEAKTYKFFYRLFHRMGLTTYFEDVK